LDKKLIIEVIREKSAILYNLTSSYEKLKVKSEADIRIAELVNDLCQLGEELRKTKVSDLNER
jgi:hypothetical protein